MVPIDTFKKYENLPWAALGEDPKTGIDCFNLYHHILKEQTGVDLGYQTLDLMNVLDPYWYLKVEGRPFEESILNDPYNWEVLEESDELKQFDILILSIGSTNCANHCAMYLGSNRIIHIIYNDFSRISPYGKWYKQYTVMRARCKRLTTN
jgi:cell wall-associated NlpC family hydrolase